eukprot:5784294-Pyramimonas_sp.AAC.1
MTWECAPRSATSYEFCKGQSVVAPQKVHGTEEKLKAQLYLRRMGAEILASIPERAAGGVASILP